MRYACLIDEPLARPIYRKIDIWSDGDCITKGSMDTKQIIIECYGQYFANKLRNLNEMINTCKTEAIKAHAKINNMNSTISIKRNESVR